MNATLTTDLKHLSSQTLPTHVASVVDEVLTHIHDGRFQRSLALMAAMSSVASGMEVGYEHYKGSYSNPVMYTPVALSAALAAAGLAGFLHRRAARTVLRWVGALTLMDSVVGFGFHIRGVARKPGGWKMPIVNVVMGPPLFAPLLFGTSAYLGLLASYLRREEDPRRPEPFRHSRRSAVAHGRLQQQLCVATAASAVFCGLEAWYSHYKSNFRAVSQWIPVGAAPVVAAVAVVAAIDGRAARRLLPAASAMAIVVGSIGFFYHARGITRRPGGLKKPLYNILYGPPIFAPLLFAACGMLGIMASLARRER